MEIKTKIVMIAKLEAKMKIQVAMHVAMATMTWQTKNLRMVPARGPMVSMRRRCDAWIEPRDHPVMPRAPYRLPVIKLWPSRDA